MKYRGFLSVLLVTLLLLSLLTGCGAADKATGNSVRVEDYEAGRAEIADGLSKTEESVSAQAPVNQKLIRKVYMDAETEALDGLLTQVEQRIEQLGGYVENRQIYNGSSRYTQTRTAELTIRIPAAQLDQFVDQVTQVSNITSLRETTDDITLSYVATESRIAALETEEARLLELLAMAENMEDLLLIESKLTDVRAELTQVKSTLKLYDNQVNYGTIYLSAVEVKEYTEVEQEPEGFFPRIGKGFMKSLRGLGAFIIELMVFLVSSLPYIIFVGLIVTAIVIPVRIHKKKKKEKQAK